MNREGLRGNARRKRDKDEICERETKARTTRTRTTGTKQGLDESEDDEDNWETQGERRETGGRTPRRGSGIRGYRVQSLYII